MITFKKFQSRKKGWIACQIYRNSTGRSIMGGRKEMNALKRIVLDEQRRGISGLKHPYSNDVTTFLVKEIGFSIQKL